MPADTGSPFNLPYPELGDPPNVPSDMQSLAQQTHDVLLPIASLIPIMRVYIANDTWTKPTDLKAVRVRCVGGGGGGGGTSAPSEQTNAAGGGAGAYAEALIPAASLASSEVVTVGSGGSGGSTSGSNGSSGSDSSFGTHCVADAGSGGDGSTGGTSFVTGGEGGLSTASTGDVTSDGGGGDFGVVAGGLALHRGAGGNSVLSGVNQDPHVSSTSGNIGRQYGGGGAGACRHANGAGAEVGGDGADGVVIVEEFF